jgi:ribosomal protein S27E
VSEENVVRFDPSARTGMARRGAPDKTQAPPETMEVECPYCAAVISLETGILSLHPEVLCAGCDAEIPLDKGGRWKVVGGRDEREP